MDRRRLTRAWKAHFQIDLLRQPRRAESLILALLTGCRVTQDRNPGGRNHKFQDRCNSECALSIRAGGWDLRLLALMLKIVIQEEAFSYLAFRLDLASIAQSH